MPLPIGCSVRNTSFDATILWRWFTGIWCLSAASAGRLATSEGVIWGESEGVIRGESEGVIWGEGERWGGRGTSWGEARYITGCPMCCWGVVCPR